MIEIQNFGRSVMVNGKEICECSHERDAFAVAMALNQTFVKPVDVADMKYACEFFAEIVSERPSVSQFIDEHSNEQ